MNIIGLNNDPLCEHCEGEQEEIDFPTLYKSM